MTNMNDSDIFSVMLKIENKDIFIDLKQNKNGKYLKISERNGTLRNTIVIPSTGIQRLRNALDEVIAINSKTKIYSRERSSRLTVDPSIALRSIYITGLSWDTTDEELLNHFNSIGIITNAYVLKQKRGNKQRSLGCGIVEYESQESVQKAITQLNETMFKDRIIRIREDKEIESTDISPLSNASETTLTYVSDTNITPKSITPKSIKDFNFIPNKVLISNIKKTITTDEMKHHFSSFGNIISVNVLATKGRKKTSSWIIEYSSDDEAKNVITSCNNTLFNDMTIKVREYYQ